MTTYICTTCGGVFDLKEMPTICPQKHNANCDGKEFQLYKMLECYAADCDTMISKEELDENAAYTSDGAPHCPNHYELTE